MATVPSVLDSLDLLATAASGLFAGTALYVTIGEVPALRAFGVDEHWRFFPHMFERAALMQSVLAAVAASAGIAHGLRGIKAPFYQNLWVASGSAFLAIGGYTLVVMMPTNRAILDDNKRVQAGQTSSVDLGQRKDLLDKWAVLHLGRTVVSLVGFGAMIYGLSRH